MKRNEKRRGTDRGGARKMEYKAGLDRAALEMSRTRSLRRGNLFAGIRQFPGIVVSDNQDEWGTGFHMAACLHSDDENFNPHLL